MLIGYADDYGAAGRSAPFVVDPSHPLARGLNVYCTPGLPTSVSVPVARANLAPGGPAFTSAVGAASRVTGVIGDAAESTYGAEDAYRITTWVPGIGAGDYTIAAHLRSASVFTHNYSGPLFSYGTFSPAVYQTVGGTGGQWGMYHGGNILSGRVLANSTTYALAAVRRSGVVSFYVDGVKTGSVANTTTWGSSGTLYVGSDPSDPSTQNFQGRLSWLGVWTRALGPDEVLSLHVSPWAMMESTTRRMWFLPAIAGGGTPMAIYVHHRQQQGIA